MKKIFSCALIGLLCTAGASLRAASDGSVYLLAGMDGKILTNQDANNYYNLSGQQIGPQGFPSPVIHLGLQFLRFGSVEASANFGPVRNNSVTYTNAGFNTRRVTTRWGLTTYSITPGITWAGAGFVNMLGLRLGQAILTGHVDDDAYGLTGSYDQEAQAYDVGLLFRSSQIMAGHFSLGFELGYDWTQFKDIANKNGKGSYDPVHSPEQNISTFGHNGDRTVLDFSGGHLALVIGLWSKPVVDEDAVPANPDAPAK